MSDDNERAVLAINKGLNHAVRINGDYLYASNATHVLRWPYTAGDRQNLGDGFGFVDGPMRCLGMESRPASSQRAQPSRWSAVSCWRGRPGVRRGRRRMACGAAAGKSPGAQGGRGGGGSGAGPRSPALWRVPSWRR